MALALFAGARTASPTLSYAFPMAALLLSDLILGFHDTMLFVYGAVALMVLVGRLMGPSAGLLTHIGASLAGSALFFVITNAGVWLVGGLYPQTLEGLVSCFVMAIPFFWKTLAGDLFFVSLFFVVFHLVQQTVLDGFGRFRRI